MKLVFFYLVIVSYIFYSHAAIVPGSLQVTDFTNCVTEDLLTCGTLNKKASITLSVNFGDLGGQFLAVNLSTEPVPGSPELKFGANTQIKIRVSDLIFRFEMTATFGGAASAPEAYWVETASGSILLPGPSPGVCNADTGFTQPASEGSCHPFTTYGPSDPIVTTCCPSPISIFPCPMAKCGPCCETSIPNLCSALGDRCGQVEYVDDPYWAGRIFDLFNPTGDVTAIYTVEIEIVGADGSTSNTIDLVGVGGPIVATSTDGLVKASVIALNCPTSISCGVPSFVGRPFARAVGGEDSATNPRTPVSDPANNVIPTDWILANEQQDGCFGTGCAENGARPERWGVAADMMQICANCIGTCAPGIDTWSKAGQECTSIAGFVKINVDTPENPQHLPMPFNNRYWACGDRLCFESPQNSANTVQIGLEVVGEFVTVVTASAPGEFNANQPTDACVLVLGDNSVMFVSVCNTGIILAGYEITLDCTGTTYVVLTSQVFQDIDAGQCATIEFQLSIQGELSDAKMQTCTSTLFNNAGDQQDTLDITCIEKLPTEVTPPAPGITPDTGDGGGLLGGSSSLLIIGGIILLLLLCSSSLSSLAIAALILLPMLTGQGEQGGGAGGLLGGLGIGNRMEIEDEFIEYQKKHNKTHGLINIKQNK